MRFIAALLSLLALNYQTATATPCADISGKYVSEKVGNSKRTIIINQKSCSQLEITFAFGPSPSAELIFADGKPYTYFAHDKSGNGALVANGQPIETSLKDSYRVASLTGSSLKLIQVWDRTPTKTCAAEVKYQPDCSVIAFTYAVSGDKLVETQQGHWYVQGNAIPESIEYTRAK